MNSNGVVAAERVYLRAKTQIVSGELAGGQLISEAKMGEELGVSRTPVHEAFLRLAAEQLLDLASRRGAIVRPLTPTEASDVLTMRRAIEGASAGQIFATGGLDATFSEKLNDNLEQQRGCVAENDVDGFVVADDNFHALIVEASGNQVALHFYEQLRTRQQRLRNLLLRIDPANLPAAYEDHGALARCLQEGDQSGFDDVLTAHLDRYQGAI